MQALLRPSLLITPLPSASTLAISPLYVPSAREGGMSVVSPRPPAASAS